MVILDNGHGVNTPGKCSPDKVIREYAYARKLVKAIHEKLNQMGIASCILVPEEVDISISTRVARANAIYKKDKKSFLVSVHLNAAGSGQWMNANGWSVFVSKNSSQRSKQIAQTMTEIARGKNLFGNRSVPSCGYWTWSWTKYDIGILKNTHCPAVLTENMFQDNKKDVEFLLSEEGFNTIVDLHVEAIKKVL